MFDNLINIDFNRSFISGILSTIVAAFILYIISKPVKLAYRKIQERKNKYLFVWIPKEPLRNKKDEIKNVNQYPKDFKFDFTKGDFVVENGKIMMVYGLDCFKMRIIKFMKTEKDKYKVYENTNYGVSFLLISNSIEDFNMKANVISGELLEFFND